MIQTIATLLIGLVGGIGGAFLNAPANYNNLNSLQKDWENPPVIFGAVSFPTSLDNFENPGASGSVATVVTHSTHHSNANDAIEALEAKVGTGASTPTANTVFVGNGVGSSAYSATPTITGLTTTNILANGSTTLQNFTFVNATGTSATTTNFFSTTASTTNQYGNNINGFGLSTCTGTSFLQWSSSKFGCAASTGGVDTFSTTTSVQMSTTTCSVANGCLPETDNIEITLTTSNMVGANLSSANTVAIFNSDSTNTYSQVYDNVSNGSTAGVESANRNNVVLIDGQAARPITYLRLKVINHTGVAKLGTFDTWRLATTTGAHSVYQYRNGTFVWENADQLSSIDIGLGFTDTYFGTSTRIEVIGW